MLQAITLVGVGGAAGSMLRFLVAVAVLRVYKGDWPWGTLIVNIIGSAAIGALMAYFVRPLGGHGEAWKLLLVTGVLGGFTTFSSFSYEVVKLFQQNRPDLALGYVAISNVAGLLAAFSAFKLCERAT